MGRKQTDGQVEHKKPDFRKGDRVSGVMSYTVERRTQSQLVKIPSYPGSAFQARMQMEEARRRIAQSNIDYGDGFETTQTFDRVGNKRFCRVLVPPYKANKVWCMVILPDGSDTEQEVKCKDFHLIGERKENEPLFTKEQKEKIMKLSTPAILTGVLLLSIFMIGGWFVGNYNSLVKSKAQLDNSWAKVETQYQRRLDLIDNIVSSVKGSQGQEQKVFGQIADARKQYSNATSTDDKAAAATKLESTVAVLPRLQEAYPELKSNEQVSKLIGELAGTENGIAGVRNTYNDTATNYNVGITSFPKSLFANLFNFEKAKLFKADAAASKAPKVNF